jgi:hypothetical protein
MRKFLSTALALAIILTVGAFALNRSTTPAVAAKQAVVTNFQNTVSSITAGCDGSGVVTYTGPGGFFLNLTGGAFNANGAEPGVPDIAVGASPFSYQFDLTGYVGPHYRVNAIGGVNTTNPEKSVSYNCGGTTATNTPTETPTNTPTATNTPTDTPTDTPTATPTETPTFTPTATNTPECDEGSIDVGEEGQNCATFTPTATDIPTNTATATSTSTNTPVPTAPNTPRPTRTPTATATIDPCSDIFLCVTPTTEISTPVIVIPQLPANFLPDTGSGGYIGGNDGNFNDLSVLFLVFVSLLLGGGTGFIIASATRK